MCPFVRKLFYSIPVNWNLSLQILQGVRVICENLTNSLAFFQLPAVTAGFNTFFQRTLTNTAKTIAEYGFNPIGTTAFTVDMFWQNGSTI